MSYTPCCWKCKKSNVIYPDTLWTEVTFIIFFFLKDYPNDPATLLSPPNRNMDKLHSFAKEVAMATTQNQLPNMQFAVNHLNEEDVAMFDFTSMSMANHSCYVKKRSGKTLLQCIVGDSLLEVWFNKETYKVLSCALIFCYIVLYIRLTYKKRKKCVIYNHYDFMLVLHECRKNEKNICLKT